jgi:hypothetical protein
MNIDINKYEDSVIKSIDEENIGKIVSFLSSNGCDYVEELLEDYLDIFTFGYDEFVVRFNKLDDKYNHNLINEIKDDMNILEKLYY